MKKWLNPNTWYDPAKDYYVPGSRKFQIVALALAIILLALYAILAA